jgi:hypothetical protein
MTVAVSASTAAATDTTAITNNTHDGTSLTTGIIHSVDRAQGGAAAAAHADVAQEAAVEVVDTDRETTTTTTMQDNSKHDFEFENNSSQNNNNDNGDYFQSHPHAMWVLVWSILSGTLLLKALRKVCCDWMPTFVEDWTHELHSPHGNLNDYYYLQTVVYAREEREQEKERAKQHCPIKKRLRLLHSLKECSMFVQQEDLIHNDINTNTNTDYSSSSASDIESSYGENGTIQLRGNTKNNNTKNNTNKNTNNNNTNNNTNNEPVMVPNMCAVCLCEFEVNETVMWSSNPQCHHYFHDDCILTWLVKRKEEDGTACPCCRQEFVKVIDVIDDVKQQQVQVEESSVNVNHHDSHDTVVEVEKSNHDADNENDTDTETATASLSPTSSRSNSLFSNGSTNDALDISASENAATIDIDTEQGNGHGPDNLDLDLEQGRGVAPTRTRLGMRLQYAPLASPSFDADAESR